MGKLVRDKIPQIIKKSGQFPITHTARGDEYRKKLVEKLQEEVLEYVESGRVEELADILEVMYALGDFQKVSMEKIEQIRIEKAKKRGTFTKRIILEGC